MSGLLARIWTRLTRGQRWFWVSDDYRAALPDDLPERVMGLRPSDRYHAKQGRSTARVRFDSPWGPLSVYLKRHTRLPRLAGVAAALDPRGRYSPGGAEWAHLLRARALGVRVPDPVAAGEWIGPWGRLRSCLLVAELTGQDALHEALPRLSRTLPRDTFERLKRQVVAEMAEQTARLHAARLFHKDLYLCHFFLDETAGSAASERLTMIDLHRLGEHRWTAARWRWKDLGQLLFSTYGVDGISDRDRLRFWVHYQRRMRLVRPAWERRAVELKATAYDRHNRAAEARARRAKRGHA